MKSIYGSLIFILSVMTLVGCNENNNKSTVSDNEKVEEIEKISVKIPIEGMSCMSCVANVKNTLSDLNGVTEVRMSLKNKETTLQYNPQEISLDSIRQAIDKIGYEAGKPQEYKE
ncbi:MAG TPA: heavy metal-associated domain-containing protein [Aequorivita sp.]|nr:heavy metal-associated domain-containing protein [Aequorivita sp.]